MASSIRAWRWPIRAWAAAPRALALAVSAMTGTWRAKVHTDPKAEPIAQASFLVEDFVPERLELKLEPAARCANARRGRQRSSCRAAISMVRRRPALPSKARSSSRRRPRRRAGLRRLSLRLGRRADQPRCASRSKICPPRMREGKADVAVRLPAIPRTSRPLEADVHPASCASPAAAPSSATSRCRSTMKSRASASSRCSTAAQVGEGETARFDAVLVGADGKPIDGQGPQVGAAAPRPALAVVQPRRLVELRVRDDDAARRRRHRRAAGRARRRRSRSTSTGAAIAWR